MKTLVCSDIHDHIYNLQEALSAADTAECSTLLCCGDLCAPFVLDVMHKGFDGPIHIVFGNNDGDRFNLEKKAQLLNADRETNGKIQLHGEFLVKHRGTELSGFPLESAFIAYHYPALAIELSEGNRFDAVFYGHHHRVALENKNGTLLLNPGSLMGYDPATPDEIIKPSFMLFNWNNLEADVIEL